MNNFDKIISLLEKSNLTEDEKNSLKTLINEDSEAKEFYESFNKLRQAFNTSRHLTGDELADYILIKNGLEPGKRESRYVHLFSAEAFTLGVSKAETRGIEPASSDRDRLDALEGLVEALRRDVEELRRTYETLAAAVHPGAPDV